MEPDDLGEEDHGCDRADDRPAREHDRSERYRLRDQAAGRGDVVAPFVGEQPVHDRGPVDLAEQVVASEQLVAQVIGPRPPHPAGAQLARACRHEHQPDRELDEAKRPLVASIGRRLVTTAPPQHCID